ncbi:MAG: HEAT repeat domain-containing protein [Spirosomaceae bacterium]|jgi:putative membrane-bound dehydrogenase-like protein|nr:HEAT repeat domain-containing protein [Spirosomataceae bacterium]
MSLSVRSKTHLFTAAAVSLLVVACMRTPRTSQSELVVVKEAPEKGVSRAKEIRDKTPIKLADGLQMSLWASDSLAPDPVAMSMDDLGRVYINRTNRQKNSEFDIRGYRHWMTESIGLQTVEDRRAFLRKTFAPEKSDQNKWLKDLNEDGSHDWRDLAVEKDEIWRLEDTNNDGVADVSLRILEDFYEEVTDVAGGMLVRAKDMFVAIAPDLWRLEDQNGDGLIDKKTSISHGYAVHIGFSGHGMSGVTEGPDGRIYWNIGDIGANITAPDGKRWESPNSGLIARSNPDGSDFELFATGLRNTHEFVFDEYGNLISSDNDGDHPGESERLVHVVQGHDAGWRSNWQYGKYTDPRNNRYNVWMNEKLFKPRWEGQAAYILPPIMNYHNGPTGMQYNPGTALGSAWKNKFFLVEFVGTPSRSHIWSFGLKPKGATFELDGEKDVVSGILPTGIKFGPDGALYVADWINGWDTKNYGRVWKLDVAADKNDLATQRQETKRRMQLDYAKQSDEVLYQALFYEDMRIRQKAQFELVARGKKSLPQLQKAIAQTTNQLARIHGIWGVGQLTRIDLANAATLLPLLKDSDPEIVAQAAKMLGDARVNTAATDLIPLLKNNNPRVKFYAAEALGRVAYADAVTPLLNLLEANNDQDLYLRHAAVVALAKIGKVEPLVALAKHPSKALRTAAVVVLRRLRNDNVALFLQDKDEYIVAEAARAINDDLSIPNALPALANMLNAPKIIENEVIWRRAINAALRVGGDQELQTLIAFAKRPDLKDDMKAEALAALGTWANPSPTDRVDGRHRGIINRDLAGIKAKVAPHVAEFLKATNPETLVAVAGLLGDLQIGDFNNELVQIFNSSESPKVRAAIIPALNRLNYNQIDGIIKKGMDDKEESVRTVALGLLSNQNVTKESLPQIVSSVFGRNSAKEQQKMLEALTKMEADKTQVILSDLIDQLRDKKISPNLALELKEAVDASGVDALKTKMAALRTGQTLADEYAETLFGGTFFQGRNIFNNNSAAQCVRCHAVGNTGGAVGPALTNIGNTLTREQLLQSLIEPSARIAPGYGVVTLTLKDGQVVTGTLAKETAEAITLTTSDAEPLVIATARVAKRENMPSGMPPMGSILSKREIRDLVEYLANLRK